MKKALLSVLAIFTFFLAFGQTSGGPDAYGYTWKNSSHTVLPPTYAWANITGRGIQVANLADDNVVGPFTVPQGFQFYWYPITQFWIGSNGYLSFNGANQGSPFPASIPLTSGANDWIAAHLSDLNFAGATNPGTCYYYANNDSIVVSYIGVPYWVLSPGFTGSNTFQIIISSLDKSITINYQSMNAGTATIPIDCITGIENNTGALGLGTQVDIAPASLSTIKFYYPPVVTYAVTDGGVNWNNNPKNGGYFVPVGNVPVSFKANVKNYGNQNLNSFTITDTIYSGTIALSNGSASVPSLLAGEDTTLNLSNNFYSQFASIYKFSSRISGITGDMVQVNNRKTQKIISVNTSTPTYVLDYSDGAPDGVGLSWQGGNGGIAVYIAPPKYPVKIENTRFYISANSTTIPAGFYAKIFDDNGPNGLPGTILDSVYVAPSSVTVGGYNTVIPANTNINITSGGVYVVWYMAGSDIALARDITQPISARSFEILGNSWAEYRDKLTEDFLIGMTVSGAPGTVANFSIDTTMAPLISFTDLSTNSPTTWHWDFDFNNDTSILQNPSYTYTTNGTYNVCLTANNALGGTTKCKTVTIRNIGIEEDLLNYNAFVYPNPAGEKAFLDLPANTSPKDVELHIYNLFGQRLDIEFGPNGKRLELNTSGLQKGVYLFELSLKSSQESIAKGKFTVE